MKQNVYSALCHLISSVPIFPYFPSFWSSFPFTHSTRLPPTVLRRCWLESADRGRYKSLSQQQLWVASRKHKRSVVALLQTSENVSHSQLNSQPRKRQLYVGWYTIIIGNQSVIQGLHGRVRGQSHRDGALLGDSLWFILIFVKLLNNDKKYASKLVIRSVIVKFLLCLKRVAQNRSKQ